MSYYAKNPRVFLLSILRKINFLFSDRLYIQFVYYLEMGKWPNLSNPQTFNEKLQWLKLYNRRPEYSTMVDKYAVKEYVANIIGDEYIIPTLGVWDKPEQIDWDALPNQFVLKTTHGGGNTGVVICRNKQTLDKKKAIDKLNRSLKEDIYRILREWPYKNVKPRILAEKYIEPRPDIKDLPDYKFFCFNGEPKYCQVITGRGTKMSVDFFDKEWNHQSFQEPDSYPFADVEPSKPEHLEKMWAAAAKLSEGIPFSRIDFYDVQENVYFGEITFYPTSGMGRFRPDQYNKILGKMISIPGEKWGGVKITINDSDFEVANIDLPDYKFFCFDGNVRALFVASERQTGDVKFDYYDSDFNHLDLIQFHPMSGIVQTKPECFEKMKEVAAKLSKGFPHVRIDLYDIQGKVYFGEMTFFHHGGIVPFHPEKWDYIFGSWITLPNKHKGYEDSCSCGRFSRL